MPKTLMTNLRNRFGTLVRAEAKKNPKFKASDALACFDRALADVLLDQIRLSPDNSMSLAPGQYILKEKIDG